jgi:hypothetical protein
MKKNLFNVALGLFVAVVFSLVGCGGGGGGGTTTVSGSTVIPATTKVLDDSTSTKIANITPDQSMITFSGTNSQIGNLRSGDVLILGVTPTTPEGMLKKVIGLQQNSDGTTTLQTGPATLEDAVQKASVRYSKSFTDSDVVSDITVAKGVRKALPLSMSAGAISLLLKDVVIYDRDNNLQTTGDQITVNGNISFKPTVDLNIEIDSSTLKKFSFSVTGEESSDLTIKAEVPIPSLDKKTLLKTYNLGTQTFFIGVVPVVVTYELGIYIGVKGNVSIGLSANANQKLTFTGGVKYEDNNWSPINTNSTEFGFQLPTIDAAAEAKCYVGPELSTKLYGVAGPFINIYGYLLLQANPQSTPWWELFAGFDGNAGAKIEMLSGKITARYDVNLFSIRKSLAQAQTTPTYSIIGRVTYNGNIISGVQVSTNGGSVTTDANGNYTISGLSNGSYTLTPVKTGYTFTPASKSVTVNGSNAINQDFSAAVSLETYSMSGTIRSGSNSGPALSGVIVSIAGMTATNSGIGTFSIAGIPTGTYEFSASKSGYDTYTKPVYYVGSNQTGLSFYLTQQNPAVQILVFDNGTYDPSIQTNTANTANYQELYDDFTLTSPSVITGFEWLQHDNGIVYQSTNISIYKGIPIEANLVFQQNIVAERASNSTPSLYTDWNGYNYSITGLTINLAAGTYYLGLNTNASAGSSSWDQTSYDGLSDQGRYVMNQTFPPPGKLLAQESVFKVNGFTTK